MQTMEHQGRVLLRMLLRMPDVVCFGSCVLCRDVDNHLGRLPLKRNPEGNRVTCIQCADVSRCSTHSHLAITTFSFTVTTTALKAVGVVHCNELSCLKFF
jgi:hypothetical protein